MARKNAYNYFDTFTQCAEYSCRAAAQLKAALTDFNQEGFRDKVVAMHQIENEADSKRHEAMEYLAREFIAPIEREDIVALLQKLDDVTDSIDRTQRELYMFDVRSVKPDSIRFAELIGQCTSELKLAVEEMSNFKKSKSIKAHLIEVNRLESEGDDLYIRAVRSLYGIDGGAVAAGVWLRLYDRFESCLDACEDVSDLIETIVLKNS